jgi:hypothetical protein
MTTTPTDRSRRDADDDPTRQLHSLPTHARTTAGGFRYALVGRGTACVSHDGRTTNAASFRCLLASSEQEEARTGVKLVQAAFHLPNLTRLDSPEDISVAATSFLRRHSTLRAVVVVAPCAGLIRVMVLKAIGVAKTPVLLRLVDDPAQAVSTLQALEPKLPPQWHDLAT